jgi:hypothetical protein
MIQGIAQEAGGFPPGVVHAAQFVNISDLAGGWIRAVLVLHLPRELMGEQRAGIADQTLQTVAGALIKCHGHQSWIIMRTSMSL